ncbi:MAG: hypothetical protein F4210_13490 [Holophagales bacterium]|nr:hypothetical protein [Holophagales bacterium]MYF96494.1 hypothetical protein [Holophagales bacterium]
MERALHSVTPDGRAPVGASVLLTAAVILVAGLLVQPGSVAVAQAVEVKDPEEAPKKKTGTGRNAPPKGEVYTWRDGDRSLRAYLQADLVVTREGTVASKGTEVRRTGSGRIVRVAAASRSEGGPVFRSPSGALMTLPGGVLLVFDPGWDEARKDAFFAANDIAGDRLSPLGAIPNGYVVATAPGFPSLELANALANLDGVRLASPNWWTERTTR